MERLVIGNAQPPRTLRSSIMLAQDIGSRHLVPIALGHLEADPFVAVRFLRRQFTRPMTNFWPMVKKE
jgi:hypothetical protein